MSNQVFSYGTLTSKFNDFEPARMTGFYSIDTSEMYPRLVKDKELSVISGHLMYLTDEEFKEADRYEGYPELYTRVKKKVILDSGLITTAWVYI